MTAIRKSIYNNEELSVDGNHHRGSHSSGAYPWPSPCWQARVGATDLLRDRPFCIGSLQAEAARGMFVRPPRTNHSAQPKRPQHIPAACLPGLCGIGNKRRQAATHPMLGSWWLSICFVRGWIFILVYAMHRPRAPVPNASVENSSPFAATVSLGQISASFVWLFLEADDVIFHCLCKPHKMKLIHTFSIPKKRVTYCVWPFVFISKILCKL
jgi:hypothetical protein